MTWPDDEHDGDQDRRQVPLVDPEPRRVPPLTGAGDGVGGHAGSFTACTR